MGIILKKINYFEIEDKTISRYLGYKGNEPDERIKNIIKLCKQEVEAKAIPKYTYKVFDIDISENQVQVLGTDLVLTGKSIEKHLSGCNKVILLCATLGSSIDKYIKLCELQDLSKALVADATASVAVDGLCDAIEEELKYLYKDKHFTFRFGLGYGDLPLALEPIFLNILDAGKNIGVNSNESFILNPRKSVACVIGISDNPIKKVSRGCVTCNMNKKCEFKVRGEHCGF